MMADLTVLQDIRTIQLPLLSALLLGGCAAKSWRVARSRSLRPALTPGGLFPWELQVPAMFVTSMAECALGAALAVTAGSFATGVPATVVRCAAVAFFLLAIAILQVARQRRPEAGCGCFGSVSREPIGGQTIARAGLLAAAAAVTIGAPVMRMPGSPAQALILLGMLATELVLLTAMSPEIGEILVRLGYSEPCEVRDVPVSRTMTALRASPAWRRYAPTLSAAEPVDIWREGCWRFAAFPGTATTSTAISHAVEIVFAIHLQGRRPPIRVAVVDPDTGELLVPRSRGF